jgi:hypothetical protein
MENRKDGGCVQGSLQTLRSKQPLTDAPSFYIMRL